MVKDSEYDQLISVLDNDCVLYHATSYGKKGSHVETAHKRYYFDKKGKCTGVDDT